MTDRNIFNNPYGVAVALIPILKDNEIFLLGVERGIEPCLHGFALPGGYINTLETAKMAGARETLEETSLNLNPDDFVLYDEAIAQNNSHLIFILYDKDPIPYESVDWSFTSDETIRIFLIDKSEELCFKLHDKIAKKFFSEVSEIFFWIKF